MIQLNESEQAILRTVLRPHLADAYKAVIFGSRAMGNARRYSDVDLALIGDTPVPNLTMALLAEALEDSMLPYMVDVVDYRTASPRLQGEITAHGVESAMV